MQEKPEIEKSTSEVFADMIKSDAVHPKSDAEKGPIDIFTDIVIGDTTNVRKR